MTATSRHPVTIAQVEDELTHVLAEIELALRTAPELRTADTYKQLAALHKHETTCWNTYITLTNKRLSWLAASAAADRARHLMQHYEGRAAALLQDAGELWPAEYVPEVAA